MRDNFLFQMYPRNVIVLNHEKCEIETTEIMWRWTCIVEVATPKPQLILTVMMVIMYARGCCLLARHYNVHNISGSEIFANSAETEAGGSDLMIVLALLPAAEWGWGIPQIFTDTLSFIPCLSWRAVDKSRETHFLRKTKTSSSLRRSFWLR